MNWNYKPYLPAILAVLFGIICIRVPAIAVMLVSGAALGLGSIYALIVYKIQKANASRAQGNVYEHSKESDNWYSEARFSNVGEPSFKKVATFIIRDGR